MKWRTLLLYRHSSRVDVLFNSAFIQRLYNIKWIFHYITLYSIRIIEINSLLDLCNLFLFVVFWFSLNIAFYWPVLLQNFFCCRKMQSFFAISLCIGIVACHAFPGKFFSVAEFICKNTYSNKWSQQISLVLFFCYKVEMYPFPSIW